MIQDAGCKMQDESPVGTFSNIVHHVLCIVYQL
jgi:hypothetical protein